MAFNSVTFLLFFPIVLFIFFIVPKKIRYVWLLVASYFFYACWNPAYLLLIIISTVLTYIAGILINRFRENGFMKKASLGVSLIINIGLLVYFKYTNFLIHTVNSVFLRMQFNKFVPSVDVILPVGISFFTFQAIGYAIDVYRDDVKVEKNIMRYALFVSFFPQLVAGPIERSKSLLGQLRNNIFSITWNYERVTNGLTIMLWGYFMKTVIADRAAIIVDCIFAQYTIFGSIELVIAAFLFAIQIYCDFAGYSFIAIGAAKVLGFTLMENFNTPYFSSSVSDFWHKWHISLSTWLRDYLYIPLGGNRKGKLRKYMNIVLTFAVSGLWHGANWTYMVWGLIHGALQIIEHELGRLIKPVYDKFNVKIETNGYKIWQIVRTFIIVDFAWIFFRADSIRSALGYISRMFTKHNWAVLVDGSLYEMGLDVRECHILIIAMLILFIVSFVKYKTGKNIDSLLAEQWLPSRWFVLLFLFGYTVIFGCYGPGFDSANFIYFQF